MFFLRFFMCAIYFFIFYLILSIKSVVGKRICAKKNYVKSESLFKDEIKLKRKSTILDYTVALLLSKL